VSRTLLTLVTLVLGVAAPGVAPRQRVVDVTGCVALTARTRHPGGLDSVIAWLKPLRGSDIPAAPPGAARPRMVQQNRQFEPHLLVVPTGSSVDFPNRDPFFHNVFSMYDGKRFDLGLYEAGTSRSVSFKKPGVSFIFCNIHPEMSAVVMAVDTPYYGVSDREGRITIRDVPPGRYQLSVWHERHELERPGEFPREIAVSAASPTLGVIRMVESDQVIAPHKNKYGEDYKPPRPPGSIYKKPGGGG
jgi:plastocyanin